MNKFFAVMMFALSGCTVGQMNYSALSINPEVAEKLTKGPLKPRVAEKDCSAMILFIPLGWPKGPNEFIQYALRNNPEANTLADVNFRQTLLYTFFYNRVCQYVDGVPVKL